MGDLHGGVGLPAEVAGRAPTALARYHNEHPPDSEQNEGALGWLGDAVMHKDLGAALGADVVNLDVLTRAKLLLTSCSVDGLWARPPAPKPGEAAAPVDPKAKGGAAPPPAAGEKRSAVLRATAAEALLLKLRESVVAQLKDGAPAATSAPATARGAAPAAAKPAEPAKAPAKGAPAAGAAEPDVLSFHYPAGKAWSQQQLWTAAWCELLLSDVQYFRGRVSDSIKCLEQLRGLLRPLPDCTPDAQPLSAVHAPDWLVWLELRLRLTRAHLAQSAHVACRAEAEVALQEAAAVNEVRLCREVTRLRVLLDVGLGHSELAVLGFSEILSQAQHQDDRSFNVAGATIEFAELQRTLGNRTAALQAFMDAEKLLLAQLEAHGYWEATSVHLPHVETTATVKLRVAQLLEQQEQTSGAEARALEAEALLRKCAKPSKALLASVKLLLGRIAASKASTLPVVRGGAVVNWGGAIGAAADGTASAKATLLQVSK